MARVIVRYSMQSGAQGIGVRNRVRACLNDFGFDRIGTATFEADDIPLPAAIRALKKVLDEVGGAGRLDNLSIYLDQPDRTLD